MRKAVIILVVFLPQLFVRAQPINKRDSLLHILAGAKEDTNKVKTLLRLAKYYETNNQDSAIYYLEKSKDLSESLKYVKGVFHYYDQKSIVSFTKGDYERAMEENNKGLDLARQLKDSSLVIVMLNHIGIVYGLQQKYQEQLDYALQVNNVVEAIKDSSRLSQTMHNLANCYNSISQYRKAVNYCLTSIEIYTKYKKRNDYINRVYSSLGQGYQELQMNDSALYFYDKAIVESIRLNDKYAEAGIYGYKSTLLARLNRFNEMLNVSEKSLELARALQSRQMVASTLVTAATAYFYNGKNAEARRSINEALQIATKDALVLELTNGYNRLSYIAARDGDYATVVRAEKKYDSLHEVVINEQIVRSTTELEKKYETEKKQKEIIQLQKDKQIQVLSIKQKSTLNYLLIASVAALLLVGFLGYRNLRHRHRLAKQQEELQQQRIRELEKDRQLVAVDSMLKGQEEERSRLAKDLHDGLGGLLSGVKFSLSNMKDNLIITAENMSVFERSLDMLDTSIRELRRVAHNMMPEMLTKFGLDEAVKEYCNTINATKLLAVKYQSLGMETRPDKAVEIIIYRIIQELLNNILKHAAATEAFVQLIREDSRLNVVVEDNGKGFDAGLPENNKGAGWVNIRSRVEYLKGQLDVHSEAGKGTLVNMEFNL
ncbi:MAG: tetratricopeptide repeat-containing sensor histidine kinase [Chitinophagaceae bacterium]